MKAKGWKQVFKFTFIQMIKNKAYITSTIIIAVCLILMSVVANFLPGLLMDGALSEFFGGGGDNEEAEFAVKTLYISDQSGIEPAPDFNNLIEGGITLNMITPGQIETITEQIRVSPEPAVLIEITKTNNGYNILASRPEFEGLITADDCRTVLGIINSSVWFAHMNSIGVPEESLGSLNPNLNSQVTIAGEVPRDEFAAVLANTVLPVISALVLFMFIIMYGQLVAQAIATEKTSRVMETLLTSVRPMAIILGKTLGMGLASFAQFAALMITGFGISAIIAPLGTLGQVFGSVEIPIEDVEMQMFQTAFEETFSSFNFMSIVWIIAVFLLGFLFYSLIAGLFGATINRIEDLQSALQPLSLIGVVGFMLAYLAPIFNFDSGEINIMQRISYYFPLSSPFALPAAIISGELDTIGILISLLILGIFCVLMLMFVSRVYEAIIMHTGNKVNVKMMFKMAKK
jgi:ABC-2 type transport system permease protein